MSMLFIFLLLVVSFQLPEVNGASVKKKIDTTRLSKVCLSAGTSRGPVADNDGRAHAILSLVVEKSTYSIFSTANSPQHRALCWMIYDDPLKIDPRTFISSGGSNSSRGKFLDRYSLVVLYMTTKGPGWVRSDHWLSDKSVCEWYGVECSRVGGLAGLAGTIRITAIDVSFNKLTGLLPREMGLLSEIRDLDLNGNSLHGIMPILMLTELKKLEVLQLHMNDLFGQIPPEISELRNLQELTLFGNFFLGKIPSDISKLSKLKVLDLYANNLTGKIPSELGKLKALEEFYVNDNELTGTMPPEICRLKAKGKVHSISSDCLGAKPEVRCDCCTFCCQGLPDSKCKDMTKTKLGKKGLASKKKL